jgi:hypothetical protein
LAGLYPKAEAAQDALRDAELPDALQAWAALDGRRQADPAFRALPDAAEISMADLQASGRWEQAAGPREDSRERQAAADSNWVSAAAWPEPPGELRRTGLRLQAPEKSGGAGQEAVSIQRAPEALQV